MSSDTSLRQPDKSDLEPLLRALGWLVRQRGGIVEVSRESLEDANGMLMIQGTGEGIRFTWVPHGVEGEA